MDDGVNEGLKIVFAGGEGSPIDEGRAQGGPVFLGGRSGGDAVVGEVEEIKVVHERVIVLTVCRELCRTLD